MRPKSNPNADLWALSDDDDELHSYRERQIHQLDNPWAAPSSFPATATATASTLPSPQEPPKQTPRSTSTAAPPPPQQPPRKGRSTVPVPSRLSSLPTPPSNNSPDRNHQPQKQPDPWETNWSTSPVAADPQGKWDVPKPSTGDGGLGVGGFGTGVEDLLGLFESPDSSVAGAAADVGEAEVETATKGFDACFPIVDVRDGGKVGSSDASNADRGPRGVPPVAPAVEPDVVDEKERLIRHVMQLQATLLPKIARAAAAKRDHAKQQSETLVLHQYMTNLMASSRKMDRDQRDANAKAEKAARKGRWLFRSA